jgi:hypothetical protein
MPRAGNRALHGVVAVCARFNLMNRLVQRPGITVGSECFEAASKRVHDPSYFRLLRVLG